MTSEVASLMLYNIYLCSGFTFLPLKYQRFDKTLSKYY